MRVESLTINCAGYIHCRSQFYTANTTISSLDYQFNQGINNAIGEIDSGAWGISYLISMYPYHSKDFTLFAPPLVLLNNLYVTPNSLANISCYMDCIHPLFDSKHSVKVTVNKYIKKNELHYSASEICQLFQISEDRFERSLSGMGNELYKGMAAIAYSAQKQIFCFPWLSKSRIAALNGNLDILLEILNNLGMMVIIPKGNT